MSRIVRSALLSCALLLAPGLSTAKPPTSAPSRPAASPSRSAPAGISLAERQDRRAMHDAMEVRTRQTQLEVAELQKRFDATADPADRQAVQLHIEAAKREGALDLFRIQLRHAQAAGRTAEASELQSVIDVRARQSAVLPPLPSQPAAASKAALAPPVQAKQGGGK